MVDDEGGNQQGGITQAGMFLVRLGDNDEAPFAICSRTGTVDGTNVLPGLAKTVAELVAEQALLAAAVPPGAQGDLGDLPQMTATGENELPGGGGSGGN